MHETDIESDTLCYVKVRARGTGELVKPEVGVMLGPVGWKLVSVSDKDVILASRHEVLICSHIQNLFSCDETVRIRVVE
jgi:hypothetical protein